MDGGFQDTGLKAIFPAEESVILPAYIIAGPGLPALIPGGGTVIKSQSEVDPICFEFQAVDASGSLFRWDDAWDSFGTFAWETAGQEGKASPVFPITAWC